MIGLVKSALNKTIENGLLRWKDLEEVPLDVEITLDNRPLSYAENDVQLPLLTPNAMLFMQSNWLPELQPHRIQTADLRKRARHLLNKQCGAVGPKSTYAVFARDTELRLERGETRFLLVMLLS